LREKPHEFLVLAEDRLQDLRMTRRSRTFEDSSDADIFSQIAGDHGLQNEVDATGPTHRIIAQVNQSDLAFMRERACAVDAELWIEDNVLHVQSRGRRDMGSAIFTLGQNLLECRICADLAGQVSGLTVSGWDVAGKEAISHRADHQSLSSELGTDDGGSAILDSAIGKRDEQISHLLPTSTEEARSLAEAHYKRVARRFLVGDCLAQGDARIRVGAKLTLESVGPLFEGEYYVTKVCHMFDEQRGFETQFTVERPGIRS
jgi:phage protein D